MPDGPLVSIMVDKISKFKGDLLENVGINSGRYIRHSLPKIFKTFNKSLPSKIKKIYNIGKFVYLILLLNPYYTILTPPLDLGYSQRN